MNPIDEQQDIDNQPITILNHQLATNMKTSFPNKNIFISLLCLLMLVGISNQVQAQKSQKFPITFGDGKDGEVEVYFKYKTKKISRVYFLNNSKIDFGGEEQGELEISFAEFDISGRSTRKNFNKNYKLVVTPKCITKSNNVQFDNFNEINVPVKLVNKNSGSASSSQRTIPFLITENGQARISFDIGLVELNTNKSEWLCANGEIELKCDVSGIKAKKDLPPPPPNPAIVDWNKAKFGGMDDWITHLKIYPNSPHELDARNLIGNKIGQKYAEAKNQGTINAYEDFIQYCQQYPNFSSIYNPFIKKAQGRIKDIKDRESKTAAQKEFMKLPCYKNWQEIKNSNEFEDFKDYIESYADSECDRYVKTARKKLPDLAPLELTTETAKDGYTAIFIKNALNPRFKDLSTDGNLRINTSRFKDENVLLVKTTHSGSFEVLIEDELGKKETYSFDDNLIASMKEDSTFIRVTLNKGSQPYRVSFINAAKDVVLYSENSITTNKWKTTKAKLQELGVTGEIQVEAADDDSLEPKKLGSVFITPLEDNSKTKYLIYGISALAILLVTIFFILFWKKRKKQQRQPINIYEEMG